MSHRMSWMRVAKAVLGGDGEVAGVAVVDCPDLDHVAAAPRRARFDPDVGEIDAGVEDDDGVLDRGFDLLEVCVCFQVKYRRPAVGLTRLRRQLNQGGRLRATSRTARFVLCDGNGPGTREGRRRIPPTCPRSGDRDCHVHAGSRDRYPGGGDFAAVAGR